MADTELIMAEPGEFMIKKPAAEKLGLDNLRYMNETGELPPRDNYMDEIFDYVQGMNRGGSIFGYQEGGDVLKGREDVWMRNRDITGLTKDDGIYESEGVVKVDTPEGLRHYQGSGESRQGIQSSVDRMTYDAMEKARYTPSDSVSTGQIQELRQESPFRDVYGYRGGGHIGRKYTGGNYQQGGQVSRNYAGGGSIRDHFPMQTYATRKEMIEDQMNDLINEMLYKDDITQVKPEDSPKMQMARNFLADIDRNIG